MSGADRNVEELDKKVVTVENISNVKKELVLLHSTTKKRTDSKCRKSKNIK